MEMWAIIPVKPFAAGKSRLAGVLTPGERAALNCRLFEHAFDVARHALGPERVVVVSADRALLARLAPAHAVREDTPSDLNRALEQASLHAIQHGARAVAILPSDLPDIGPDDIAALKDALGSAPSCAIAPDAADQGTNALALAPPVAGLFRFGPQSFSAHLQAAHTSGYRTRIVRRPGLAHDLDTPESYRAWLQRAGVPA